MAKQTIPKPLGLIKDFRSLVHGIPCALTFIIIQSSVLDSSYFMLLGCPWLRDVKVSHDWANNTLLYRESIKLEPYPLLRHLEHQLNVQKY
jgi:hypothetical protein